MKWIKINESSSIIDAYIERKMGHDAIEDMKDVLEMLPQSQLSELQNDVQSELIENLDDMEVSPKLKNAIEDEFIVAESFEVGPLARLILFTGLILGSGAAVMIANKPYYDEVHNRIEEIQHTSDEARKQELKEELAKYIQDNHSHLGTDYRVGRDGEVQHTTDTRLGSGGSLNPKKWHSIDHCKH